MVPCAFAYHEEVGAEAQEVFAAAREVLRSYGLSREDSQNLFLESNWVMGRSERSRSLILFKIRKDYLRQTRFRIQLKRWPRFTEIEIRADYRFKRPDGAASAPWRKMKPKFQDYSQERDLFRKILAQVEFNRRTSQSSPQA